MRNFLVVSIHEANKIFLIECSNIYTFFTVQFIYKIGILNNHHPLGFALIYHEICESFLVCLCECILSIGTEFTIVRRIKKNKIIFVWLNFS